MRGRVRYEIIGSLAVVIVLALANIPSAPAGADPCALVMGEGAIANRVCYHGETVAVADGAATNVQGRTHASVTFVTFTVDANHFVVLSRAAQEWSAILPGTDALGLRFPAATGAMSAQSASVEPDPYRLVQLRTPMIDEWMATLGELGYAVHAYIPTNGFIISSLEDNDKQLTAVPFVYDVTHIEPISKLEPALLDRAGLRKVNVLTMPGAPGAFDATRQHLDSMGAELVQLAPEIERIQAWVDAAQLPQLAAFPHILWMDQAGETGPENDMNIIRQMTGADHVLNVPAGFDGTTVVGQVMDSGLDAAHPDFQAALLGLDGPSSPNWHGTSVFGIVFGDGTGDPNAKGMAPGAHGTFAQYGQGTRYQRASNVANDHGGVFQTHSWGNGVPKDNTYDSFSNENDRVVLDLDVLMLQSMSNCGPGCARREAMAKNILSIGGMYHLNTADLADDSWQGFGSSASTGPAADGRIKPELVGPYDSIRTTTVGGYTSGFGGTSGATPVVAGAVALTHDMWNQDVFGSQPQASPAMVKALLIASANAYDPDQVDGGGDTSTSSPFFLKPVKRDIQGWGLPDLKLLHDNAAGVLVMDQQVALQTGEQWTTTYTPPPGATGIHVTVTWTDAPANPAASPTLVNDLDLVVGLLGIPFFGNFGLDIGELSLPTGTPDRLNNVENVFLPVVNDEPITIAVRGASINLDTYLQTPEIDQRFALAVVPLFD